MKKSILCIIILLSFAAASGAEDASPIPIPKPEGINSPLPKQAPPTVTNEKEAPSAFLSVGVVSGNGKTQSVLMLSRVTAIKKVRGTNLRIVSDLVKAGDDYGLGLSIPSGDIIQLLPVLKVGADIRSIIDSTSLGYFLARSGGETSDIPAGFYVKWSFGLPL